MRTRVFGLCGRVRVAGLREGGSERQQECECQESQCLTLRGWRESLSDPVHAQQRKLLEKGVKPRWLANHCQRGTVGDAANVLRSLNA